MQSTFDPAWLGNPDGRVRQAANQRSAVSLASVVEHRQIPERQPWQEVRQWSLQSSAGEHPAQ